MTRWTGRYRNEVADPASRLRKLLLINQTMVDLLRARPCTDCSGRFPATCMDFDHLPEYVKERQIPRMVRNCLPSTVLEEVAKCEVVCANCHRLRTKERQT